MFYRTMWLKNVNQETWRMVGIGQGPCAVGDGDDCTWLARGLETLSVLIPDKKCEHHGIMLLAS